jgi:hypothetical protein
VGWDPAVDAVNDYERLTYQLPLNGVAYDQDNKTVFSLIQLAVVHSQAETWIYDHVPGRDGRGAMQALCNHYEGEVELDVQASKAQQVLNTLVYTNEKQMTFKSMITKLNKAYNTLKRQGQEFTEKSKVEQLAKRIKNPSRDVQITVAVETMRETHKTNYTAATQYITARMAQINSASINAPGINPRRVSEVNSADLSRNEFNGIDICDPWRKFTDDEWFNKLGQRGQELVRAKRHSHGGRGHGGRGRGQGRCFGNLGLFIANGFAGLPLIASSVAGLSPVADVVDRFDCLDTHDDVSELSERCSLKWLGHKVCDHFGSQTPFHTQLSFCDAVVTKKYLIANASYAYC